MTDRLRHSPAGYRRLIQITQAELFVFVEGKVDRVFYDNICSVALERYGIKFEIRMAGELPVSTGGKPGVLEYYDLIRRRNELVSEFKGKTSVLLFFLDKDIDDITRRLRRSQHVIYTGMFEVENYLYRHGDVVRALAMVLRVPRSDVRQLIPDDWHVIAAEAWQEWTIVCVAVQLLRVSVEANYRVPSRINEPCTGPTNKAELDRRISDMRQRSSLSIDEFDAVLKHAASVVKRRYGQGKHDTVMRGKWYPHFLRYWTAPLGNSFGDDELTSVLLATLVFDAPWSVPLVKSVEDLARQCGLIAA